MGTRISHLVSVFFSLTNSFVVYGIFFLETVQTALSGVDLYHWFAAGFGNFDALLSQSFIDFDVPILGSVVSLSVQFFFAYRIFVLSEKRSWWLCVIICLVNVFQKVPEYSYHLNPFHSSLFLAHLGHSHRVYWWVRSTFHHTARISITADVCIHRSHWKLDAKPRLSRPHIGKAIKKERWDNSLTAWLYPTRSGSSQTCYLTYLLHPRCSIT